MMLTSGSTSAARTSTRTRLQTFRLLYGNEYKLLSNCWSAGQATIYSYGDSFFRDETIPSGFRDRAESALHRAVYRTVPVAPALVDNGSGVRCQVVSGKFFSSSSY
eukprot:scaffold161285_cov39-Prasinocladus_malaysianus.AAC.1